MPEVTATLVKQLRERTGVGMGKCKEALVEADGDIELAIANLRKAGMASAVKKGGRDTNEGLVATAESSDNVALVEVNAETDFVVKNEKFQEFAENVATEAAASAPASVEALMSQKYSGDANLTVDEYRAVTIQSLGENIQVKRLTLIPKGSNSSVGVYSHAGGKLVTAVEIEGSASSQALAKEIAMHIAAESPDYISSDDIPEEVLNHERDIAKAQVENKPANIIDKIVEGKLKAVYAQICLLNQPFVKDSNTTIAQLLEAEGKSKGAALKVKQFLRWRVGEQS